MLLVLTMLLWFHPPRIHLKWRTPFIILKVLVGAAAIAASILMFAQAYSAH
jgi:uncharacterized membrane protein